MSPLPAQPDDARIEAIVRRVLGRENFPTRNATVSLVEPGLRAIRGIVNANGSIAEGAGFSVTRHGAGEFTVTFDPGFSDIPAVAGSGRAGIAGDKTWAHDTADATKDAFRCSIRRATTGLTIDIGFHFIAVGPA